MKIKKALSALLALTIAFSCCAFAVPARAADEDTFRVRVNGYLVDFPDAQPFCDEHQRTLAPIRFVTEQLGATVSWRQADQTAVITKAGTTVEITIGSPELRVMRAGKTETVTMDTEAVGRDGRTYVPIRFVAEALGAYVDWSQRHRVVGVYQGELTPGQIEELQTYEMTFDSRFHNFDANTGSWADMREDLYASIKPKRGTMYFHDLDRHINASDSGEYYANVIKNVEAAIEYHSDNLDVNFAADPSCIYQQADSNDWGATGASVRGVVTVKVKENVNYMTGGERYLIVSLLGMSKGVEGETYTFPIDAHVLDVTAVQLHEVYNFETGRLS